MTAQTWKILHQAKDQMTFRLFLLLNSLSAVISIPWPFSDYTPIHTTSLMIFIISSALLSWQAWNGKPPININIAASGIGILWALHIFVKHGHTTHVHVSNQMTISIMVLFIGTICFSNNIDAFLLHCSPATITELWLNSVDHRLQMLYFIALPTVGIMFQHIIQRRNEICTELLMSKLVEEKETLSSLSKIDYLTGLFNRRGFEDRLEQIQSHGEGNHYVLLIDIDHFKLYNDHNGHGMGDKALFNVAAAIRDTVRSRDIVSRYGGEEFLVLLTEIDCSRAIQAADRIRQRVYDLGIVHKFNNDVASRVTVSIGIAALRDRTIEDALSLADKALYQAKHQGRNISILSNDIVSDSLKLSLESQ